MPYYFAVVGSLVLAALAAYRATLRHRFRMAALRALPPEHLADVLSAVRGRSPTPLPRRDA